MFRSTICNAPVQFTLCPKAKTSVLQFGKFGSIWGRDFLATVLPCVLWPRLHLQDGHKSHGQKGKELQELTSVLRHALSLSVRFIAPFVHLCSQVWSNAHSYLSVQLNWNDDVLYSQNAYPSWPTMLLLRENARGICYFFHEKHNVWTVDVWWFSQKKKNLFTFLQVLMSKEIINCHVNKWTSTHRQSNRPQVSHRCASLSRT